MGGLAPEKGAPSWSGDEKRSHLQSPTSQTLRSPDLLFPLFSKDAGMSEAIYKVQHPDCAPKKTSFAGCTDRSHTIDLITHTHV